MAITWRKSRTAPSKPAAAAATAAVALTAAASVLAVACHHQKQRQKQFQERKREEEGGKDARYGGAQRMSTRMVAEQLGTHNGSGSGSQKLIDNDNGYLRASIEASTNHSLLRPPPSSIRRSNSNFLLATSAVSFLPSFSSKPKSAFERIYEVDWKARPLGSGGFGTVHIATHRKTGEKVAVKRVPKRLMNVPNSNEPVIDRHVLEGVQRERDALRHIQYAGGGHPHICSIRDEFGVEGTSIIDHAHDDDEYFYLVLELITGGELFDHLIQNGAYSEADAARLIREVASALAFLHGIGCVHGDLKPENLLMSTPQKSSAAIKLVDFGTACVTDPTSPYYNAQSEEDDKDDPKASAIATTPGYSSPELLANAELHQQYAIQARAGTKDKSSCPPKYVPHPSIDMWSLGVILYIMLTGAHPFDLSGTSTDEEMNQRVKSKQLPPKNARITAHLSDSAVALLGQLLDWDPTRRLTALELLHHPWVLGETAGKNKMTGSDARLKAYRKYKSKLEAKVFASMIEWSDDSTGNSSTSSLSTLDSDHGNSSNAAGKHGDVGLFRKLKTGQAKTKEDEIVAKRTSLIERSFQMLDPDHKGYITTAELSKLMKSDDGSNMTPATSEEGSGETLSLSGFSDLLAENMKNRYFPADHVIYREGDEGHKMYFINSGRIEVTTKGGFRAIHQQGEFFGEGALLHPKSIRSSSTRCLTPVHAIEISREYFEKYIADEYDLQLNLRETDKSRKRQRAKTILKLQQNLFEKEFEPGEYIFKAGEEGNELYILEEGLIEVSIDDYPVFIVRPGGLCGEHSLILNRPRNTSTKCIAKGQKCKCLVMLASDFYKLMDSHPSFRESMRDICLRREFQKALVYQTRKAFPDHANEEAMRVAFDAADENQSGKLDLSDIHIMLRKLDPTLSDDDLQEILSVLDLDRSGAVSFEEFRKIFGASMEK